MMISLEWLNRYLDRPVDADEADRVLTAVGFPLEGREPFHDDEVLDVEVTSNRPDVLSHLGAAREIAAATDRTLAPPAIELPNGTGEPASELTRVTNDATDLCPVYTARVITGVKVGPSPNWLVRDLEAIDGIKIVAQVADLRTYAQRCRVALWPGRSLPAQGKPVLQAMAMGMPCVTSLLAARQLGVPLRSRRTTGPLAACVGRQAWFERIAQLWTVPDAASAMGAAARNWAVDHADWQRNTDALDALIEHAKRHDRHERVTESPDIASSAETEPTNLPISFRTAVAEDQPQPPLRKAA